MTPEVGKAWIDILTEGRGLLITLVILNMLAGVGIAFIAGLIMAWRMGIIKAWQKDIDARNRDNRINEVMIKICEKAGYGDVDIADTDTN
ncbi:unnamed protein product [marine sediment metagenome]|uniref:Uncharacterized protein n=1 Tax=marine sediment metagenome TaxID=412755 RepID=X0YYR1_9ZZZZ